MSHPSLGLPPHDASAGLPAVAARLRASNGRIAKLALQWTLRDQEGFEERYDEEKLRLFLRDLEQHVKQLARAIETGEDYYVASYGEWLVPVYRRRQVPMRDFMAILKGLQYAAATLMTPDEKKVSDALFERWSATLKHHQRLAGDHKGNAVIRFFWKGAGIGDDKWV